MIFLTDKNQSKDQEKINEMTETLQRVQADFENYKKRVEKENQDFIKLSKKEVITKLLPILDSFSLAFSNKCNSEEFVKGIELIYSQFMQVLEDEGVKKIEAKELEGLVKPCKMRMMPNYVFRQSNPAIVGVDIISGELRVGNVIMKEGKDLSTVKSIQHEKDSLSSVEAGKQVAISLPSVTVGRQINENDIFYSSIPEPDFRKLKTLKKYLKKEDIEVLKEIAELKRKQNPLWGI